MNVQSASNAAVKLARHLSGLSKADIQNHAKELKIIKLELVLSGYWNATKRVVVFDSSGKRLCNNTLLTEFSSGTITHFYEEKFLFNGAFAIIWEGDFYSHFFDRSLCFMQEPFRNGNLSNELHEKHIHEEFYDDDGCGYNISKIDAFKESAENIDFEIEDSDLRLINVIVTTQDGVKIDFDNAVDFLDSSDPITIGVRWFLFAALLNSSQITFLPGTPVQDQILARFMTQHFSLTYDQLDVIEQDLF